MKTVAAIALLLVSPLGAAAEWVGLAERKDVATVYYDAESLVVSGDRRKTWIKVEYEADQRTPAGRNFRTYTGWVEFDCRAKTRSGLATVVYDEAGNVVERNATGASPTTVEADSLGDIQLRVVCEAVPLRRK